MAFVCIVLVALSAALIPEATSMLYLVVPHFVLGLAIGIIDAAMMPLLALLVDSRHVASYGTVYAIAETAVSFAYCFGPGVSGYLVKAIGFPWVMRSVAMLNLLYCPLLLLLRNPQLEEEKNALVMNRPASSNYEAVKAAGGAYTRFNGETEDE
ncbi:synaptic vesicular amine transporter-like [Ixodes scapularis]